MLRLLESAGYYREQKSLKDINGKDRIIKGGTKNG